MKTFLLKVTTTFLFLSASICTTNAQNIYTFAGTGVAGFGGDGGTAIGAKLSAPYGVAFDASGNVYILDLGNNRIRKVNSAGVISTFAGTGVSGFSGDGGPSTAAKLAGPSGITIDALGNLYISDWGNNRIRKVNTAGVISTFAGTGVAGFNGDGGNATAAQLNSPYGIAVDTSGNLYISDLGNNRIRKVNKLGVISTFAGTGVAGFSGDGSTAAAAQLNNPIGVAVDVSANVYIADFYNNRIRKVNTAGVISTLAGTGVAGFSGDGGTATAAQLNNPYGVAVDVSANVYVADYYNNRIRKVSTAGVISTYAGTGIAGFSGDGGVSTGAQLNGPIGVSVDTTGNVYIADFGNQRIREVCVGNCFSNINSLVENKNKVLIYPNPNNGSFQLKIENEIQNGVLILVNSIGQRIFEQKIIQGKNNIITNNLATGLYHYIVLQNNQQLNNGKLVIE
ncbi:MAG TPA: T9SS type A sorting domain-containing protein [Bacteroidia bacterium]|jgi:sugar lactone lactonase YvrE|nr:T9SS type A sorting domain-containing protein [Bacteroidia bacterium]